MKHVLIWVGLVWVGLTSAIAAETKIVPLAEIPKPLIEQIRMGIAARYPGAKAEFDKYPVTAPSVKAFRVYYKTNPPGSGEKTIWTSGLMLVPTGNPDAARDVVSWQHGTEVEAISVPSNPLLIGKDFGLLLALYAGGGAVVTAADYPGLGFSPKTDPAAPVGDYLDSHPYVHARVEATSSYDLIRSVTDLKRENAPELAGVQWSGDLFLSGYSQGGHSTLALHRMIDTHARLAQELGLKLKKSVPMAGPYSLSEYSFEWLMQVVLNNEEPAQSYEPTRGSIFSAYLLTSLKKYCKDSVYEDESEAFTPDVEKLIKSNAVFNGTTTWDETMKLMPARIPDVFKREYFEKMKAQLAAGEKPAVQKCLEHHDLISDWAPKSPVVLIHADRDLDVQYANAILARERLNQADRNRGWKKQVELRTLRGLSHVTGALPAMVMSIGIIAESK